MTATAHLALDLGAESGRAMLGVLDAGAGRLELHEVHRFANVPQSRTTGLHWSLEALERELVDGIGRAIETCRAKDLELRSLGVDTWGVDYGLLDEAGELLEVPHCYRDDRNDRVFRPTMDAIGADRLYAATGIQFMALNTLFQLVAQRDAAPELLERADRLLFMPDLLHHRLTGRAVNEASIASTSQMIDPRDGTWAEAIVRDAGLPTGMLHPTVPAGTTVGPLRDVIAAAVAAPAHLEVITPAAHDTASAVAAVPAAADGAWCYLSSGTWSLLGAELDAPCLTDAARETPFTNEGGVDGTIRFLKNISGLWLVQECRRDLAAAGHDHDYATLTAMAAAEAPFRTLVDPDHPPFAAPGAMREKIRAYAQASGQPVPERPGQFVRTCLESLALAYRRTLVRLEEVLGRRFDILHIVGGGARNELLSQMTADATGRRVAVGPFEATAIGNVLVQAMGAGAIGGVGHLREIVSESFPPQIIEPDAPAQWDPIFDRFLALLADHPGD